MNTYDVGDLALLTASFTDENGSAIDPTDVYCIYTDPSGNSVSLHYGVDAALQRSGVGTYQVELNLDEAGIWTYRWYSTGTGQASETRTLEAFTGPFAYCTLAEVKAALGETSTTYDDAIELSIRAAKTAIAGYCHSQFLKIPSEIRYFSPDNGSLLMIDDALTISEVASDEDGDGTYERVWAVTDYASYPLNTSDPITNLRTASLGRYSFPVRRKSMKITAVWGWQAVPDGVHRFSIMYAQRLVLRKEVPFGVQGGNETGAVYLPKNDPDAKMLLGAYVRNDVATGIW